VLAIPFFLKINIIEVEALPNCFDDFDQRDAQAKADHRP
jgi:hypothetical protein